MRQENEQVVESIIWLVSCALHEEKPDSGRLANIDAGELYKAAKRNFVSAMVYTSLEGTEFLRNAPETVTGKWKEDKDKAIARNILFDRERGEIIRELEKAGIWYAPLKGIHLQHLYPEYGMREMADNDILFDDTRIEDVRKIFLSRGYKCEGAEKELWAHLAFVKKPIYCFEMHKALFVQLYEKETDRIWRRYADVRKYLIKDVENQYGYHFNVEEEYIYNLAHIYKHYVVTGTAVRMLIDLYLMNQRYHETWDRAYIRKELRDMRLDGFEQECRELCRKLFNDSTYTRVDDLPESEKRLLRNFSGAGICESQINRIYREAGDSRLGGEAIGRATKLKYMFRRVFPTLEWCKYNYPTVYRYPWLYPFFVVWRIVRGIFVSGKKIAGELRFVFKA